MGDETQPTVNARIMNFPSQSLQPLILTQDQEESTSLDLQIYPVRNISELVSSQQSPPSIVTNNTLGHYLK
jgi:hypothetical protein